MRRNDWIWIFFVIIAVGLVLSWGRTGQRLQTETAEVLDVDRMLDPESPCNPRHTPCAAFGRDLALVLGPVAGSTELLALRLVTDESAQTLESLRVDWQDQGTGFVPGQSLSTRRVQDAEWLVALPVDGASTAPSLWVRLEYVGLSYAARFPLSVEEVQ